ncbi:MAG: nucleoside-diphosphate kinase [Nanobdellota archaeon]
MKIERTLIIIKPDALNRSLVGKVISRIEQKGLKIMGLKMARLDEKTLDEHYSHLSDKPFFKRLKEFMMHSPSILLAVEGLDAVRVVRQLAGETHGAKAMPGTVRGDFSMSTQSNVIHASESKEVAEDEIKRFFNEDELFVYERVDFELLYADDERR